MLEQLEAIRVRTGIALELDEAVLEMVRKEAGDVVDIDEMLKVFQVVPRTVEVDRVVEKVIGAFMEVPVIRDVVIQREVPIEMNVVQPFERKTHVVS